MNFCLATFTFLHAPNMNYFKLSQFKSLGSKGMRLLLHLLFCPENRPVTACAEQKSH